MEKEMALGLVLENLQLWCQCHPTSSCSSHTKSRDEPHEEFLACRQLGRKGHACILVQKDRNHSCKNPTNSWTAMLCHKLLTKTMPRSKASPIFMPPFFCKQIAVAKQSLLCIAKLVRLIIVTSPEGAPRVVNLFSILNIQLLDLGQFTTGGVETGDYSERLVVSPWNWLPGP